MSRETAPGPRAGTATFGRADFEPWREPPPSQVDGILRFMEDGASASLNELSGLLSVSGTALRRDLETLRELRRVAVARPHVVSEPTPSTDPVERGAARPRAGTFDIQLAKLAGRVAGYVSPGDSLALTAGPVSELLLPRLAPLRSLTVVTNSPTLSSLAMSCRGNGWTVILTGGMQSGAGVLTGHHTRQSLVSLHFDLTVIDDVPRQPCWRPSWKAEEVEVATILARAAQRTLIVCLHPDRSTLAATLSGTVDVVSAAEYSPR